MADEITGSALIQLKDAELYYFPDFFHREEADRLFEKLLENINWKHEVITIFGKKVMQPRLTAWHGDKGSDYSYSGIHLIPENWTEELLLIKKRIEELTKLTFNSVLLNQYRDGNDGVGWHSDAEKELGKNPVIASVSLGGSRKFQMMHRTDKDIPVFEVELKHGSLLIMAGATQHFWKHRVPKTSEAANRINLTFRKII